MSQNRLLEAARLLFDEPGLQGNDMLACKGDYPSKPLHETLNVPVLLKEIMRKTSSDRA